MPLRDAVCTGPIDALPSALHLSLHAQHLGDGWAADVDVQQADLLALTCQSEGQLRRERALAHASLPRENQDLCEAAGATQGSV